MFDVYQFPDTSLVWYATIVHSPTRVEDNIGIVSTEDKIVNCRFKNKIARGI